MVPRSSLRSHPGARGFLGVLPARRLTASGSVSRRSPQFHRPILANPLAACASYLASLRPPYRSSERLATSSSDLSVLVTLAGAPTALRDFPQAPVGTPNVVPISGRFLSVPSTQTPCGAWMALKFPLPSSRAHFHRSDLSEPVAEINPHSLPGQVFFTLPFQSLVTFLHQHAAALPLPLTKPPFLLAFHALCKHASVRMFFHS